MVCRVGVGLECEDLDQASTVYLQKISEVLGIPPKINESEQPPEIIQLCILALRKSPKMFRNNSPK